MADIKNEFVFELLKRVHAEIGELKSGQGRIEARLSEMDGHMREFFKSLGRPDAELVELRQRIERRERRLEIAD